MADQKLKVGLVIDTDLDASDGVQQYVLTLGKWLQDQGHEVRYLTGYAGREDLPGLYSLTRNLKVRFNGNRLSIPMPASRRKIKRILAAEKFDVLHVQTPHSPVMAQKIILAASPETAIFGTFHILPVGWTSRLGNRLLGYWLRPSLKRFDEIVSVSSAAAEFAEATFGIKTGVLPNVINLGDFDQAKPFESYDDDVLTVLFLGRLVPRKGALVLLKAVALSLKQAGLPKFRVVICGKGPLEKELRRFIGIEQLSEIVEMVGYVSEKDKPRYYASADIAVFPSQGGESFGIVLLEAMASGKAAVLAANNPGYRTVIGPQSQLLFKTGIGTTEDLVVKLQAMLRDAKYRQEIAAWGGQYVKQFDVDVVGKEIVERYKQALRKRRGA